jgi:hypothetical protein
MAPWMFDIKFPHDTQLTFGSLTFATREDGNLRMLPPGPAPECLALVHGQDLCCPATSSTSGGDCIGLDSCAGLYIRTAKLIQGILVMMSILRPSVGASSLSSLVASPDQDSSDDYPEIGISTYGDFTGEGRLIFMVAPTGDPSHNSSGRYPTIRRLEASDARTPNNGMIQNLNPDFNVVWLQTIMESIQRMTPEGSPLIAWHLIIVERSAGNPQREPFVGNDWTRQARNEAASSASGSHCLADNDARWWIT